VRIADVLGVVVMDDVGVRKTAGGDDFAREPLDHGGIGDEAAIDHLERHDAVHEQMLRLEYRPHPADAEQAEDSVARMIRQFRRHLRPGRCIRIR
jgi:hypothetical protein